MSRMSAGSPAGTRLMILSVDTSMPAPTSVIAGLIAACQAQPSTTHDVEDYGGSGADIPQKANRLGTTVHTVDSLGLGVKPKEKSLLEWPPDTDALHMVHVMLCHVDCSPTGFWPLLLLGDLPDTSG